MKKHMVTNAPSTTVGEFSRSVGLTASRIRQLAKVHPLPKPSFSDMKRHKEVAYYHISDLASWFSAARSEGSKNANDCRV